MAGYKHRNRHKVKYEVNPMLTIIHDYSSYFIDYIEKYHETHKPKSKCIMKKTKFIINQKWKKCYGGGW